MAGALALGERVARPRHLPERCSGGCRDIADLLVVYRKDWSPTFEGLFLYYPGHRQVPATLRALIDMIRTAGSKPGKSLLKNPFTKF